MNDCKYLDISVDNYGLQKIIFNKPEKKNALDTTMIKLITSILRESATDSNVKITAFSGVGDYFTSGNDLSNYSTNITADGEEIDINELLQLGKEMFGKLVAAFIDYPKPLVAVVNGAAVGLGVTILAHFDLVFASSSATFSCPFVRLGLTPEACSSYLFPVLMGHSKAAQMILFGKKITAQEAFENNLVTEVVESESLPRVWDRITALCALPPNTSKNAKGLLKQRLIPILHRVNREECNSLVHQWKSDEFLEALMTFSQRKSKL